jgi:hypothetical protein
MKKQRKWKLGDCLRQKFGTKKWLLKRENRTDGKVRERWETLSLRPDVEKRGCSVCQ